jgi:hypothetical protein
MFIEEKRKETFLKTKLKTQELFVDLCWIQIQKLRLCS